MFNVRILIALKKSDSLTLNNAHDMLASESLSSSLTFSMTNQIIIACKILNARSFSCWSSLSLFLFEITTCRNVWTADFNVLDAKTFWAIWTFKWISWSSDACDVILNSAFKLIAIIFSALVDSDETSIMKVSDFETSVDTLFFDDLLTDLRFERTLNVCLQSCKFMSSLFSSSANLTAWLLMTRSRSEAQRWYCLSMSFTYFMNVLSLFLFMNLSHLSSIDNDLRLTCK